MTKKSAHVVTKPITADELRKPATPYVLPPPLPPGRKSRVKAKGPELVPGEDGKWWLKK